MRRSKNMKLLNKNEFPLSAATAAATSSAIAAPPWIELPSDVTANILRRLGAVELLQSAQFVCATWWNRCKDPTMWRVINIENSDVKDGWSSTTMCRHAVDRSQGQVIDLTINELLPHIVVSQGVIDLNGLRDNELLPYIAVRSSELRRLTLACCNFLISGTAITEAVKKLPNLEELHLIQNIDGVNIEAIGISCPMLKSFTFDKSRCKHPPLKSADYEEHSDAVNNYNALAIAKNMPNLCRLRLFANELNNEGLQAILDGCPHLESLDLRQCFGVDLGGALGGRCREQIKDLRLPSDSVDDYGYKFLPAGELSYYDDDVDNLCSADADNYDSDCGGWY